MYYRLTNFYQNHRRYVRSLDTSQLKGNVVDNGTIDGSACDPLRSRNGKAIYPCGLIANSIFNDTINSPVLTNARDGGDASSPYRMSNQSIAWGSDSELYKKTDYHPSQVSPPPNWAERYPDGYTEENFIDLSTYEEFQVWMRTAGLPTFSKLALRNDNETLQAGTYELEIYDYFPTREYDGTKSILLSTRTVVGGKNSFLGIAYVVVAGICVVIGVVFTLAHLIRPRSAPSFLMLGIVLTIADVLVIIPTCRGTTPISHPPELRQDEITDHKAPELTGHGDVLMTFLFWRVALLRPLAEKYTIVFAASHRHVSKCRI